MWSQSDHTMTRKYIGERERERERGNNNNNNNNIHKNPRTERGIYICEIPKAGLFGKMVVLQMVCIVLRDFVLYIYIYIYI
jgi:hypothetical protein